MTHSISARWLVLFCLAGGAAVCAAQRAYTPPPPPLTTLPPCPVPKDAKDAKKIARRKDCDPTNRPLPPAATPPAATASAPATAAQKFPYPGDQPAKPVDSPATKAFPFPGDAPATAPAESAAKRFPYPGESAPAPAAPVSAPAESAAKRFPYPGESAPATASGPTSSAPAASSSAPAPETSSSSSGSDDTPAAKDTAAKPAASGDDDDDGQPKLSDKGSEGKRNKKTIKPQTDSERVDEDLSIARFYGQSGNPMGAYLRAKDAVKTEPDLPEARFTMGEAAQRLNKKDEAKAEFSEYLKLAPDGEHAKAAEKALSELR